VSLQRSEHRAAARHQWLSLALEAKGRRGANMADEDEKEVSVKFNTSLGRAYRVPEAPMVRTKKPGRVPLCIWLCAEL
jgi:hypothetical protein